VNTGLTNTQIVGLLVLMVALRGSAAKHIAAFQSDIDPKERSAIMGLFKAKLSALFNRD